jgi:HflK protein
MNFSEVPIAVLVETLRVTAEAGIFVLLGLFVAGLLHEFLDTSRIVAALGGRSLRSILTATLLGAPLPLCSCGVLPAALSLRKKGASREATIAFLISTPETGVDSIAITYGLLGPVMAIARPLAAIVTGLVAGLVSLSYPAPDDASDLPPGAHAHSHEDPVPERQKSKHKLVVRLRRAARYGFGTLLDDLAFWLAVGFVVTGVLQEALPPNFFERFLPSGLLSLVVMAVLGIPTYVCASASTPVAAAMMAKGLNPGAALVFLLTGPATNPSTVGVVARLFGRRFVFVYLGAILGVALTAGTLMNALIGPGATPPAAVGIEENGLWGLLQVAAGIVLIVLLGRSLARTGFHAGMREIAGHVRAAREGILAVMPWRRLLILATAVMIAVWVQQAVVVVGPGEQGVARAFGRVSSERLAPGLHVVWPPPFGQVDLVSVGAIRTVEIGYTSLPASPSARVPAMPPSFPELMPNFGAPRTSRIPDGSTFVTGDETLVSVTAAIQYEIADPAHYQLGVDRPDAVLRSVARAALVEAIGRTPIDALYSNARGEVEAAALQRLRRSSSVDALGIRPLAFYLLYVHAPDEVHGAFRDVASAAEDRSTLKNKALVEAEGSIHLARGSAARSVSEAESYRLEQVEHARGNAAAFVPLAKEDRRSSAVTRDRLYLEAMERVLGRTPKLIKPDARDAPGVELWVTPQERTAPKAGPAGATPDVPPMDEEGTPSRGPAAQPGGNN